MGRRRREPGGRWDQPVRVLTIGDADMVSHRQVGHHVLRGGCALCDGGRCCLQAEHQRAR